MHTAPRRIARLVALVLSIPFLGFLAFLTLTPRRVEERMPGLLAHVLEILSPVSIGAAQLEVLANVLVFVPVGILALMLVPARRALFVGPVLSSVIELSQAVFLPNRVATIADVVANSLGATLGVAIAAAVAAHLTTRSPILETS